MCILKSLLSKDNYYFVDDYSILFAQMTDIANQKAVHMFINFIDGKIGLPMGTIQPFGPGDNNLYAYNPVEDPHDPPPNPCSDDNVRDFIYVCM